MGKTAHPSQQRIYTCLYCMWPTVLRFSSPCHAILGSMYFTRSAEDKKSYSNRWACLDSRAKAHFCTWWWTWQWYQSTKRPRSKNAILPEHVFWDFQASEDHTSNQMRGRKATAPWDVLTNHSPLPSAELGLTHYQTCITRQECSVS